MTKKTALGTGAKCCGLPDSCDVCSDVPTPTITEEAGGVVLFGGDLSAFALDDDEDETEEDDE